MAEKSYPLNDTDYLAEDAQLWHATRTKGVYSADDNLAVVANNGMTITVKEGIAWAKFNKWENAVYGNTSELDHTLELSDSLLPRIDRIVIRWDKVQNHIYQTVKTGVPSSKPIAPIYQRDPQAYELVLADITVKAGALQINQSDIKDQRLNEDLCGIMRDGVTGIPTQQLYDAYWSWFNALKLETETIVNEFMSFLTTTEQNINSWFANFKIKYELEIETWLNSFQSENNRILNEWFNSFTTLKEEEFHTWFETIKDLLSGDVAGNLANQILEHESKKVYKEPVHGIRFNTDGRMQIEINANVWANTTVVLIIGFSWLFLDNINKTWQENDNLNLTWNEFENQIETEA